MCKILVTTSIQKLHYPMCRVLVLDNGHVVEYGPPRELLTDQNSIFLFPGHEVWITGLLAITCSNNTGLLGRLGKCSSQFLLPYNNTY